MHDNRRKVVNPPWRAASRIWWVVALVFVLALPGCEQQSGSETTAASGTADVGLPPEISSRPRIGILPEGAKRPDVVVILVDALRADRVGAYGHKGEITPTMDALSAEGVTFECCVSAAPWTLPSVATMFTSVYPGVHQAKYYRAVADMEDGKRGEQSVLTESCETMAEVFKKNGYQTAAFVAAKFLRAGYGFGQGFDTYDTSFADNTVRGELVNKALFEWLDTGRDPEKPLFLYLHYMDVHGPYDAAPRFMDPLMEQVEAQEDKQLLSPQEFKTILPYLRQPPTETTDPTRHQRLKTYREYWVARYEAGVAEMDFHLGELKSGLEERGIWPSAYVIMTADHGEALCEHGLWGHGYSLYQTDLHVPLLMRCPGLLPPKLGVRRLASTIDIMPTLVEQLRLAGAPEMQGRSLVDHISGRLGKVPQSRLAEAVKTERGDPGSALHMAMFADNTKFIVTNYPGRTQPDGSVSRPRGVYELYDLARDPVEMNNMANQYPDYIKKMAGALTAFVAKNHAMRQQFGKAEQRSVDQSTLQDLKSLGYAGGAEEEPNEAEPEEIPATAPAETPGSEGDG